MAGSISVLGLGSSALNADTIDQLREADKKILLGPANKRADKNIQQREDFTLLMTEIKTLQSSASVFAEELSYLKRSTTYSGDGGSVSAQSGVNPQSGQIYIEQLAQKSIYQSKGYGSESDIISSKGGETITIALGPDRFEIEVTAGMNLGDLKDSINTLTGGGIEASILNVGGDEPYSLVLKSSDTGLDNAISVTIEQNEGSDDLDLGFEEIQAAQDAKFDYNGIAVTRDTNTVDDLIVGVTFKLEQQGEYINYDIKQDLEEMADKFEEFVTAYNQAMSLVDELTDFDSETKTSASFQGETRVTSIRTSITNTLFTVSPNDDTITDYGLEVSKEGPLVFDKAVFQAKMSEDPSVFESFFRGNTEITEAITIGEKAGYQKYNVGEIMPDGSISTATEYVAITEDTKIGYDSVKINGISLPEITLLASNTPEENTQLIVKTINSIADDTGVKASVSGSGDKVILQNASGGEIAITGATSDAKEFLGLTNSREVGSRDYSDGLFNKLDDYFESLIVGEFSTLGLLESSLKNETKRLDEEIAKTMERIESKYSIMEAQFASYNSVIKQFESDFGALQMQIDTMVAKK